MTLHDVAFWICGTFHNSLFGVLEWTMRRSLGDWRAKGTNSSVLAHIHFWSADSLPWVEVELAGPATALACPESVVSFISVSPDPESWAKCVCYLCDKGPWKFCWISLSPRSQAAKVDIGFSVPSCGFSLCLWAPTFPWFPPFYVHLPFLPSCLGLHVRVSPY